MNEKRGQRATIHDQYAISRLSAHIDNMQRTKLIMKFDLNFTLLLILLLVHILNYVCVSVFVRLLAVWAEKTLVR